MIDPRLPNFFILGAFRGGTASLHSYLAQHPALYLSQPRDPRFFDKHEFYWRGPAYYAEQFFAEAASYAMRGEASATYFVRPEIVAPRWWSIYGGRPLKAIVLLRNPLERIWSHHLYRLNHGYEQGSLADALAADASHPLAAHGFNTRYLRCGEYNALLTTWQESYPAMEVLCLLSEELDHAPGRTVRRVLQFLEVDDSVELNLSARLNQATQANSYRVVRWLNNPPSWARGLAKRIWREGWMRNEMRRRLRSAVQRQKPSRKPLIDEALAVWLRDYYRADIEALSQRLDLDLSHWLSDDETIDGTIAVKASSPGKKIVPGDIHH